MTIEIHSPEGEVKEWVISYLKDQLRELPLPLKEISRAEVYFRLQDAEGQISRVCQIDISVFGSSFSVRRAAATFAHAMRDALNELNEIVEEQIRRQKEPPDEVTSTVEV